MSEMTLPSRNRIRETESEHATSRLSWLCRHTIESLGVNGEETFVSLKLECQSGL